MLTFKFDKNSMLENYIFFLKSIYIFLKLNFYQIGYIKTKKIFINYLIIY